MDFNKTLNLQIALLGMLASACGIELNNPATFSNDTSSTSTSSAIQVLYSKGGSGVRVFSIDSSTGALTQVGSDITTAATAAQVCMSPDGKNLYVPLQGTSGVEHYTIDQTTGGITVGSTYPTGAAPLDCVVDNTSSTLYVLVSGTTAVTKYDISSSDGTLSGMVNYATTGATPIAAKMSSDNANLFVTQGSGITDSGIDTFVRASDGTLTGPNYHSHGGFLYTWDLVVHPTLDILYSTDSSGNDIRTKTINTATDTTATSTTDATQSQPRSVDMTSDGACVYTANNLGGTISIYSANASTGALTTVNVSEASLTSFPADLVISPDDKYLYVVNQAASAEINYWSIASDCSLTHIGSTTAIAWSNGLTAGYVGN